MGMVLRKFIEVFSCEVTINISITTKESTRSSDISYKGPCCGIRDVLTSGVVKELINHVANDSSAGAVVNIMKSNCYLQMQA